MSFDILNFSIDIVQVHMLQGRELRTTNEANFNTINDGFDGGRAASTLYATGIAFGSSADAEAQGFTIPINHESQIYERSGRKAIPEHYDIAHNPIRDSYREQVGAVSFFYRYALDHFDHLLTKVGGVYYVSWWAGRSEYCHGLSPS